MHAARSCRQAAGIDDACRCDRRYAFLAPEPIAEAIVHAVNQPWGVSISDITVRASGDYYIA